MNKRTLGKTGLNVTCLGFGAMEIGKLDLKDAETLLNEVLDQGITLIDSSPVSYTHLDVYKRQVSASENARIRARCLLSHGVT